MAYFSDPKAALTGTDKATRISIAKGYVSPTFKSTITGQTLPRGVVQFDAISGNDIGYATHTNVMDRIKSATSYFSPTQKIRKQVATPPTSYGAGLHESSSGTIPTTTNTTFTKKATYILAAIIGIILISTKL